MKLAVLGGVKAFIGDDPVPLRSRKANALLAYLALSGKVCLQREFLAGLLWSDVETAKARSSLRQSVTELRSAFGETTDFLIIGRSEITLRMTEVRTDIDEILEAIAAGQVPDVMLTRTAIVDSILHGFEDLGDSFGEWLNEFRTATERRIMELLEAGYRDPEADYSTRKRMAESALLLDPMQESACRDLMMLAAEAGDLGTALRAYERLYTTLDQEMGMEPSPATQDLVVRIKQGEFEPQPDPGAAAPAAAPRPAHVLARPTDIPRLAVMPLQVLGAGDVPDHLAEMLLDDIVCKLAGLKEPAVISSNSTRTFSSDGSDAMAVRDKLDAQYALYGKIGRLGTKYRLSVELNDLRAITVVWAGTFDIAEEELFLTLSLIAGQIANQLVPSLNGTELRLTASYQPRDLTAYHLTLRARELLFDLDLTSFDEARKLLTLALEKDASFVPAYVTYANWYSLRMGQNWSEDKKQDQSALVEIVQSALRLPGHNSQAIAMLGHNQAVREGQFGDAMASFNRALETAPNDAETLMWTAPTLAFRRQTELALDRAEQAIRLSPQDPLLFRYEHFLAIPCLFDGQIERAAELAQSSMRRNPHYTSNIRLTIAALVELGRLPEAKDLVAAVVAQEPSFSIGAFVKGAHYMDAELRQYYAQLLEKAGLPN